MRILFLSPTNAGYCANNVRHNGGGWVGALAAELSRRDDMKLGIAFEGAGAWNDCRSGISYFPITANASFKSRMVRRWDPHAEERLLLPRVHRAIADFKPDIVHIFGSENAWGCIAGETDIPCVIHLQGFLPAYDNAKYPPGISRRIGFDEWLCHPLRSYRKHWFDLVFRRRAAREIGIVKSCNNFFGRTDWDRDIVELYHPGARYWYCSEMLREEFYRAAGSWRHHERREMRLVSVLSTPTYKGHDLILKTADLLKRHTEISFRWKVFGGFDRKYWERQTGIVASEVNVDSGGVASAETLREELLDADVFVHPSYIDNSPNGVCEAQMLGMPVVAVNAGGVGSLIRNGESGCLVPANDPISMAARIKDAICDRGLAEKLGKAAAEVAAQRHDRANIILDLLRCYNGLLGNTAK